MEIYSSYSKSFNVRKTARLEKIRCRTMDEQRSGSLDIMRDIPSNSSSFPRIKIHTWVILLAVKGIIPGHATARPMDAAG